MAGAKSISGIVAGFPLLLDTVRWVLEAGFKGERKAIRAELRRDARTLDIGCGTGEFADCFEPSAYFGVDLSPAFIARAKSRRKGTFAVMDARRLRFGKGSFSQILIVGLLHHLSDADAEKALKEAARVLKPGGRLLAIEDVPARTIPGILGGAVHALDLGNFIRSKEGYGRLLGKHFEVGKSYFMRSGVCDYAVFAAGRCKRGKV